MFTSLSRGTSRVKPSYICRSCQSRILSHSELQLSGQLKNRGSKTASEPFSTTADDSQTQESDDKIDEKPIKSPRNAEQRNALTTPIKRQTDASDVLRDPSAYSQAAGGDSNAGTAEGVKNEGFSKGQTPKSRGKHKGRGPNSQKRVTSENHDKPSKAKKSNVNDLGPKLSPRAKSTAENKGTVSTAIPGSEPDANGKASSIAKIVQLNSQSINVPAKHTKKGAGTSALLKINDLLKTVGEAPTRDLLVKIIQAGKLSDSERNKAMRELRATLVQKVQSPGKPIRVRFFVSSKFPSDKRVLARQRSKSEVLQRRRRGTLIHKVASGNKEESASVRSSSSTNALESPLAQLKGNSTIKNAMRRKSLAHQRSKPEALGRRRKATRRGNGKLAKKQSDSGPIKPKPGLVDYEIKTIDAEDLQLTPVEKSQLPVPTLSYGLERVLFNPGVYHLQDPRSRVFNFDPYLQSIMPVHQFDFTALKQYITSSRDTSLLQTAAEEKKKYTGSTSSMTAALAHFHFLLSQWRPINTGALSQNFPVKFQTFTALQRGPSAIFLRWKDGTYAIDADKEYDNANILSMLGKSMEKLLTLSTEDFEMYRKENSDQISEEARNEAESFHYTTMGDFLMRSQLDAYDSRLPGTGMFDLKTRAVVSIRMDTAEYEHGTGYEIRGRHGEWESFEREYYDMIRAAFLKYSLQVRMGRMDGIFVAFHNTERIFGFQYISLPEMDYALHGSEDTTTGDSEFKLSLELLNRVLDRATAKYPEKSMRLHFETRPADPPFMYIFAKPVEEDVIEQIQASNKAAVEEFERRVLGISPEKTEEEILEEQKNAEWERLRARVEQSMHNDELGIQDARVVAQALIEESEILGSGELSAEETERRVDELMSNALFGGNFKGDEDDGGPQLVETDGENRGEQDVEGMATSSVDDHDNEETEKQDGNPKEEEAKEGSEPRKDDVEEIKEGVKGANEDIEETKEDVAEVTAETPENGLDGQKISTEGSEMYATTDDVELAENRGVLGEQGAETIDTGDEESQKTDDNIEPDTIQDTPIASEIKSDSNEGTSEILAMTLTIRNKINGRYVERPETMSSTDKWTVEYALAEVPSQERATTLYEAAKTRRRKTLKNEKNIAKDKWNETYIAHLRNLSKRGRAWRRGQNEIDQAGPVKTL